MTARVALVGVNGHGHWHLTNIARLAAAGTARLSGVCDVAPVQDSVRATITELGASLFTSLPDMLDTAKPDVVVIATPPATHAPMATAAMAAGADVLVEKPATVLRRDLEALVDAAARFDRRCQIGFQSCGSYAPDVIAGYLDDGTLGRPRRVFAAGAWSRPVAYFRRSSWSGRRYVGTTPVGDGAVANPFAHALMNCLDIAGATEIEPECIEAELFHANDIESDDTSSVRVRCGDVVVNLAVTLCADSIVEPYVVVVGERATARWDYPSDDLLLDRNGVSEVVSLPPRRDLLVDLIEARRTGRRPVCPPERCRAFMSVAEHLLNGPAPTPIAPEQITSVDPVRVRGVSQTVTRTSARGLLFSEAHAGWA